MNYSPRDSGTNRILIKSGTVVSMDEEIGVLPVADILIEDGIITAVGQQLDVPEDTGPVQIVSAEGHIIVPGFVNAHMHTWQTALRGIASNWTLLEYFRWTHAGLATHFAPEDIYWGTYAGALNQINCGTTTLADWCHNNPTPQHTDAAVSGLHASGIRATFFHGSPKPDPKPGEAPFWEIPHDRTEIERLLADSRFAPGEKLRLGMAVLGPHYSTLDVAFTDFRLARELSLVTTMHQGGGEARTPQGWAALEDAGLLGPHINIVHGNDLDDKQLQRFIATGVTFSVTPENEMTQGHGHPIIGRLRDHGVAPSIGIDLEAGLSGEMFLAARIALVHQRAMDNFRYRAQAGTQVIPETSTITTLEALRWATVEGARMLGLLDQIGTITPGKRADLVFVDATLPNMQPVHDPVNSVVMQTSLANIEAVMIDGRWRKRDGRLLNDSGSVLDSKAWLEPLKASGHRLATAVGLQKDTANLTLPA
jgi:cytosine/adenosine deaminase-related metal-dependent hydrolase